MKTLIGVLLVATLAAAGIAPPAMSAPEGPRALPASDISAPRVGAFAPQITTAPDGTATAVWRRFSGSNWIIQAATRPPGGSFGAPVDLSVAGRNATSPQITTAPDGTATVVWTRFNGSNDIIQAATRPPGESFGPPADLSAPGGRATSPQVATASDGTTTAVWIRSDGANNIIQAATRPPGGSFGTPVDLSVAGQDAFGPQITKAPDGTTTGVWGWGRSIAANNTVQAATRPPGGSFGAPVDLSATGRPAFGPQITTAPDGTKTAVWQRYNGANVVIQAATRPPGEGFGPPVDLSAPGWGAVEPQVATAPDGTTTAVWQRYNGANVVIQAATRPPGGSFGAPVDLSVAGRNAYSPQVATAPDGTATAVWRRFSGSNWIVQAATRPPGGSFGAPVDLSLPAAEPRLANLKITPKSKKVRRGKKTTFKLRVKNTGNAAAKKLKVCAKGPKKLVMVPKCRKPGKLAAGKSKTVKFKVKVKNRAKKGKKAKLTFTATAKGAKNKSGKATVKIR